MRRPEKREVCPSGAGVLRAVVAHGLELERVLVWTARGDTPRRPSDGWRAPCEQLASDVAAIVGQRAQRS